MRTLKPFSDKSLTERYSGRYLSAVVTSFTGDGYAYLDTYRQISGDGLKLLIVQVIPVIQKALADAAKRCKRS